MTATAAADSPIAERDAILLRVIARTCRRRTLVVADAPDLAVIARRELEVRRIAPDQASRLGAEERFDSVVVIGVMERRSEPDGNALLDALWPHLGPGGRLVVAVPNEDAIGNPDQQRFFSAKSLRQLLRSKGRPKVISEQPFRWLLMSVDQKTERRAAVPATRLARYEVMSRLCRGRVIELGCGAGGLTATIARRGLDAVGVDISHTKIAAARTRYPHLRFERRDILELRGADERFDTVVLAEVLEHVTDAVGAGMLDTAWHLLRPGGRLVVSVPNENCIPHPNHVRAFTRESFRRMLEPFGKARLETAQPYKWLLMHVRKPPDR